jgi:hypothetical protein
LKFQTLKADDKIMGKKQRKKADYQIKNINDNDDSTIYNAKKLEMPVTNSIINCWNLNFEEL